MDTNLEDFSGISEPPIYSLSKEAEHEGDLIMVMNESEIYRFSASHEGDDHGFVKTLLFKLRV